MTPQEFLDLLWHDKPEDQFILIWTWPDRRSRWFTTTQAAAEYVAAIDGKDVYAGVGLSGKDYGVARRCVSQEITAIAGLAGDFDVLSEAHKGKPLPETIEQALTLLPPLMPPSLILLTGNGYQAWWLFKEPYVFDDDEDRQRVSRIAGRWHTMLRLNSAKRGWTYERLADLARVLRIPGTKNLKDKLHPKDVKVLRHTDFRYTLSNFVDLLDAADIPDPVEQEQAAHEWRQQFADKPLTVNLDARFPQELLDAYMNPDVVGVQTAMRFRNTWFRQRHDLKDQSNSGYDMALVDFGLDASLSDQQIVDLIVHHRAHNGQKQKTDPGYFRRTITKAVATREGKSPVKGAPAMPALVPPAPPPAPNAPATDAAASAVMPGPIVAPPAKNPVNGAPPRAPEPVIADGGIPENLSENAKLLLCQDISLQLGVEVIRIVRFKGKEPTYHMHTGAGVVELDGVEKLITYQTLLHAIAARTGKIIKGFKPKEWAAFRQKLLDACIDEETTEEEEFEAGARNDILDYLTETDFIETIEGQRVQDQKKPMIIDGHVAVASSDFAAYMDKTKGRKLTAKAAASMLGVVGAKKTPRQRSSRFASQSRWALPLPDFDPNIIKPGLMPIPAADAAKPAGEMIH